MDTLSVSDVYHWLVELLEMHESLSFTAVEIFETVLLRLFFSFLSFFESELPIVLNLFDPDPSTGPVKMAKLEDKEVVVIRDDLVTQF